MANSPKQSIDVIALQNPKQLDAIQPGQRLRILDCGNEDITVVFRNRSNVPDSNAPVILKLIKVPKNYIGQTNTVFYQYIIPESVLFHNGIAKLSALKTRRECISPGSEQYSAVKALIDNKTY